MFDEPRYFIPDPTAEEATTLFRFGGGFPPQACYGEGGGWADAGDRFQLARNRGDLTEVTRGEAEQVAHRLGIDLDGPVG